ncbi:MAG: hypothetical protein PHP42_06240 [Bacteroidota bacterium]|nr:hypothetical protein [Bacteroidota bacterium]
MQDIIQFFSAMLTPVIAIVTVYIAIQQYRLSKFRTRHELFERRSAVYKAVMIFLRETTRLDHNMDESLSHFMGDTADSFFLFKSEINDHIESLYLKGIDLWKINEDLKVTSLKKDERRLLTKKRLELVTWFGEQINITRDKFHKYLALDA